MKMSQRRWIVSALLGGCTIVAVLLLARPDLVRERMTTLAEAQSTPLYLPNIIREASEDAVQDAAIATPDDVVLPPNFDSDPETPDIEPLTTLPPEPFRVTPYLPVPTPDLKVTSVPELDQISITNLRPLTQVNELIQINPQARDFGLIAWSPDSKFFTGYITGKAKTADGDEVDVPNLYLGNTETGELSLWSTEGVWSSWSRDGKAIYYLSPRHDGEDLAIGGNDRPIYDLYRRAVNASDAELVMKEVRPPYVAQLPVVETSTGSLLTLAQDHQPVLLNWNTDISRIVEPAQQPPVVTSLLEMVGRAKEIQVADGDDEASKAERIFYKIAPDGNRVAVIPMLEPFYIVDISSRSVITDIRGVPQYANNVAWSPDAQLVAYATQEGVSIYNLVTSEQRILLTSADLGAQPGHADFVSPYWIAGGNVIFVARSPDWAKGPEGRVGYSSIVASSDGKYWRVLSEYSLESVSPNGRYAIGIDTDQDGNRIRYLAEISS